MLAQWPPFMRGDMGVAFTKDTAFEKTEIAINWVLKKESTVKFDLNLYKVITRYKEVHVRTYYVIERAIVFTF